MKGFVKLSVEEFEKRVLSYDALCSELGKANVEIRTKTETIHSLQETVDKLAETQKYLYDYLEEIGHLKDGNAYVELRKEDK